MNETNPIQKVMEQTAARSGRNPLAGSGKLPPQATEMEMAVLGALLLEKDAFSRIMEILRPEMFYKEQHKVIYEVATNLFRSSEPIDLLTMRNALQKEGKLEGVGGAYYLSTLTAQVASAANIEFHARIVAQKYLLRELIRIADGTIRDAYSDTTDVFDLLDKTEKELFTLSETNLRRNYSTMEHLVYETMQRLEEMRNKDSSITGVPSGFAALDEMTSGWQSSDLVIVAARPAMGKTAFTLTLARNAAVRFDRPVAFFSLEMAGVQLAQRLISGEAEIDQTKMRNGRLEPHEWQILNSKIGKLSKAPLFIDDTPALSVMDLRAKARRLKAEKGIGMIIIDYLQLMTAGGKGGNREQEISTISRSLKELAKELNIPVIALSQLSRQVENRSATDKRPMLSDLRESGAIEQDADMVMFLYRPEYYGILQFENGEPTAGVCEVIIAKQRNGPVGDVRLQFINQFAKFTDLGAAIGFNEPPAAFNQSSPIIRKSRMDELDDMEGDVKMPF